MAEFTPVPRVAYIRTLLEPDKPRNEMLYTLAVFARQKDPELLDGKPKHHFLFSASNTSDRHILDILLSMKLPVDPSCTWGFENLQRSDFEVHISENHAATPEGQKLLDRCNDGGIQAVISGIDDNECDEILLQKCDYIIDNWTTMLADPTRAWYWNTVWAGKRQDNMLTNPKYDVSKYDVSKTRLRDRYNGYGWRHSSGCYHGNGDWQCRDCGGNCKRGRCRVNPGKEQLVLHDNGLPEKGSKEWLELSVEDICERYRWQKASRKHVVEDASFNSIDTFSGD